MNWIVTCLTLCSAGAALIATPGSNDPGLAALTNVSGGTPLYFVANSGQYDKKALFQARTPGYTLWLTREGLAFDRIEKDGRGQANRGLSRMTFVGADPDVEVVASDPSDYRVSYFYGRDESGWKTGIPTSKAVLYKNLYEGIDLKVYGTEKQVEYDWIVAPGADPAQIRIAYSGAEKPALDEDGSLVIETPAGRVVQRKPVSHQLIDGRKIAVESAFRALEDGSFGFSLGAYDPSRALVIDPLVLVYSTYLGGRDFDSMLQVAADRSGAIYTAGFTRSGDFPPDFGTQRRVDFFVTKLSPDGASLIYTAFFPVGPYLKQNPLDIFVDAKGFVYLAGQTSSSGFPVKNAFQTRLKGYNDGFILKLSRDGRSLIFSSYIGGGDNDWCMSMSVDGTGAAYLGGLTHSRDFPRKKAYQASNRGAYDGFVAKVSPQGSGLVYSTYLGGTHDERVNTLAVDADGALVLAGRTASPGFPRKSAFQKSFGGFVDGFIAKLNAAGTGLEYSSYFGGASFDEIDALALDPSGAVYLTGYTLGKIPLKNAFQASRQGHQEAFVLKVEPDGRSVAYASYLGGAGHDIGLGIAVDADGAAYVVGLTQSFGFPIKFPYQPSLRGSQDGFLTVVDPSGGKLKLSTFLGGSYRDQAADVFLGAAGEILIGGETVSPDLPKAGTPYQDKLAGDNDAFVFKFTQGNNGSRR